MSLPIYKDFSKTQDDLANKFYCHSRIAELNFKVKSEDNTEVNVKLHQPGQFGANSTSSNLGGESTLKYKYDDLTIEAKTKLPSVHSLKLEVTPKKFNKDLKLTLNNTGAVAVEYKHKKANLNVEYVSQKEDMVNLALVAGSTPALFGLDLGYNLKTGKFNRYNFAMKHYDGTGNSELVLKHLSTNKEAFAFGNFLINYYQKINPTLAFVSELSYNVPKNAVQVTLSSEHKVDDSTTIKSKVNSDGKIAALFRHSLNRNIIFNLSAEVDSKQLHGSASSNQFVYGMLFEFSY